MPFVRPAGRRRRRWWDREGRTRRCLEGAGPERCPDEEGWMEPPSLLHGALLARKDVRKVSI